MRTPSLLALAFAAASLVLAGCAADADPEPSPETNESSIIGSADDLHVKKVAKVVDLANQERDNELRREVQVSPNLPIGRPEFATQDGFSTKKP